MLRTTVAEAAGLTSLYLSRPGEPIYFDTETTGLGWDAKLVALQIKQGERDAQIFDVRQGADPFLLALSPIFEKLLIVGHNLKFDLGFLRRHGIKVNRVFDTQIAEQLIRGVGLSDAKKQGIAVNLEATAGRYGIAVSKTEREWFIDLDTRIDTDENGIQHIPWIDDFPSVQLDYMAQDVDVLPGIVAAQIKLLQERKLVEVFKIEMRTLPALAEMEFNGIHIDAEGWRAFIAEKDAEAKRLEGEALGIIGAAILEVRIEKYDRDLANYHFYRDEVEAAEYTARTEWEALGEEKGWGEYKVKYMAEWRANHTVISKPKLDTGLPDIGSTTQLIAGLKRLGVPVPTKRNDKGEWVETTESDSLEPLAANYPVVQLLLDYRKQAKFVQSFGEALLQFIQADGRIHPDYQQIGASTGRMSCVRPNWQQVPSKGDGHRLRELVTAETGHVLLTADFSNIELRILANISGDAAMIAAFNAGLDLHSETARKMFNLGPEIDPKTTIWKRDLTYRQIAKIINFMLVYGGSPFKLAKEIGIEVEEAEKLVEAYFRAYPGVAKWMAYTKDKGVRELVIRTLSGRARFLGSLPPEPQRPAIQSVNAWSEYKDRHREWTKVKRRYERQSLNTPIQGTSADITKLALALFHERASNVAKLVACVHDEIVVECREEEALDVGYLLKQAMKQACDTYLTVSPVPMPEVEIADHWSKG
jgi:DNA polymerase-1